jgi:hypothetical protein
LTLETTPPLSPRDKLLRDNFTQAETTLFVVILAMALLVHWIGNPRSFWLLGSLLILGSLTPFILKTHEQTHPFFVDLLWRKFWMCTLPAWALTLQFIIGLTQNPLNTFPLADQSFHTLDTIQIWRPSSAADTSTWLTIFGLCAAYFLCSTLYLVPKSRSFFERLFPWLCLSAVTVGIFGYIQKGLGLIKPLFTNGTGATDFFAFFPYDGHWAAFAILWSSVCIAMALLSTRYDDSAPFIHSSGPWYLTGGILLGASGFLINAQLPAAVLLLTFSAMLLIVTVDFLSNSKDPHRKAIATSSALAGCLCFAGGIFKIFQDNAFPADASALRSAAYAMFKANPIFGWGFDSYSQLLPFFGSDFLLGQRAERASSDLLQLLAEFGLFGTLILIGTLVVFITHYIRGEHHIRLTNHLLLGCAGVLLLSAFDTPFMSPAVVFSFLVIFFSALRWAEISRNKIDEVDAARPQLVTPASQRRVPFFNKQYQEKEK